jgi:hypothetical protein
MNNPPAFPTNQYANGISPSGFDTGMTLRDYFAAKAMPWVAEDLPASDGFYTKVATLSYELADAMLEAREA